MTLLKDLLSLGRYSGLRLELLCILILLTTILTLFLGAAILAPYNKRSLKDSLLEILPSSQLSFVLCESHPDLQ